jgi:hypothetical protein
MKNSIQRLFTSINSGKLQLLNSTSKVSFAFAYSEPQKIFTTADLWNIQRQSKSRQQRRFL